MVLTEKQLYQKCLDKWGISSQLNMTAEECVELAKVIIKMNRRINGSSWIEIIEETVDVELMVNQLKTIFDLKTYEQIRKEKLKRLEERLNVVNEI